MRINEQATKLTIIKSAAEKSCSPPVALGCTPASCLYLTSNESWGHFLCFKSVVWGSGFKKMEKILCRGSLKAINLHDLDTSLLQCYHFPVGCLLVAHLCCCCDQSHLVRTVGWQQRKQLSAHVGTLCTQLCTAESLSLAKTSVRVCNQLSFLINKRLTTNSS